jgi:hypothetical protein
MSFGGSTDMLKSVLKTAGGGGDIGADAHNKEAMKYMPSKPVSLMLFNGANLFQLIAEGTQQMGGQMPPFQITTKIPAAMGVGVSGSAEHVVVYVPRELLKEMMMPFMMMGMGGGPATGPMDAPAPAEPRGGEDF